MYEAHFRGCVRCLQVDGTGLFVVSPGRRVSIMGDVACLAAVVRYSN